jgi:hypothetical protein
MFALALTLTVLAAPPRGFVAAHSVELVTQVDTRLAKWLTHGGDREALLANEKELGVFLSTMGVKPADLPKMVEGARNEQLDNAELKQFTATRALLAYQGKYARLSYFDADSNRCEVTLFNVGTEAKARYVLLGGPRTDSRTIEAELESGRASEAHLVFLEKVGAAWNTGSLPKPPPPDCTGLIKNALKTIFTAEKAYFAEKDAFSNSLGKIGVDAKSLGISSVKVSVAGNAPHQTFVITVGHSGGLMTMDEKGQTGVIAPCP